MSVAWKDSQWKIFAACRRLESRLVPASMSDTPATIPPHLAPPQPPTLRQLCPEPARAGTHTHPHTHTVCQRIRKRWLSARLDFGCDPRTCFTYDVIGSDRWLGALAAWTTKTRLAKNTGPHVPVRDSSASNHPESLTITNKPTTTASTESHPPNLRHCHSCAFPGIVNLRRNNGRERSPTKSNDALCDKNRRRFRSQYVTMLGSWLRSHPESHSPLSHPCQHRMSC
jgi:hypothetical protein